MKLYELNNAFISIRKMFDDGEIDHQTFEDSMDAIGEESESKLLNCMMMMREFESNVSAVNKEIERLQSIGNQEIKKVEWLKEYIKKSMLIQGNDKIDLGLFKLTLKQPTKKVEVLDESKLPSHFFVVVPETRRVDKLALSSALKLSPVEGAQLIDSERALLIK